MKGLIIVFQYLVPHHLLSRLVGRVANSTKPWIKNTFITRFAKRYGVDMREAVQEDPTAYPTFNAFFTRALKDGVRPINVRADAIVSPADGLVSAAGNITEDCVIQAKGKSFSLTALLGGSEDTARPFRNGAFATVYLSPKDYHRVHMPCAGTLRKMIYVPGKLFSVNQATSENIDNLFARNERVVCMFDTAAGPLAMVLVGAMIVAGIETVWAGQVAPSGKVLLEVGYDNENPPLRYEKGAEMGRFKLGSTVILVYGKNAASWLSSLGEGCAVRVGEVIGALALKKC
jgi:phosphatidylserine decarboxylase